MNSWLDQLKARWLVLSQAAVWILSIVVPVVLKPPQINYQNETNENAVIVFFVTCIIGILWISFNKKNKYKHYKFWLRTSLFLITFSVLSIIFYSVKKESWTISYYGSNLVVGDTLLEGAQRKKQALEKNLGRTISDQEFPQYMPGRNHELWDIDVLRVRRYFLLALYVIVVMSMVLMIVTILQTINCFDKKSKPSP